MKVTSTAFLLYLLIGTWGCTSIRVSSDFDDEVDFSQYKSFDWMEKSDDDAGASLSLLDKRIIEAIEAELVTKGYQKLTTDAPDLLVDYITSVDEKIMLPRRGDGQGMGEGRRRAMQTYTEGTLILDLIDPRRDQTVWRGWAISVIDEHDESEETVRAFVETLLEQYPPK